jgi:hypothetical protein
VEPATNIDALLGQQIPGDDENAGKRERAKNVILATLISLPPSERAAVMNDPKRLQMTCKNAIFGSLVSDNDKICAICASNMQRSQAYSSLGKLSAEKQNLAYSSLNRLEMLMASSDIDDNKKEGVRKQAMQFFSKAIWSADSTQWTFPKSPADDGTITIENNRNKAIETLCLAHLLHFIGQESYEQLPLDKIYTQKNDGTIDDAKTMKTFVEEIVQP